MKYLGDDAYDGKSIDGDRMLNKEYPEFLDKPAYNEFWQDVSKIQLPPGGFGGRKGSQMTPGGTRRDNSGLLPEITGDASRMSGRRNSMAGTPSHQTAWEDPYFS